MKYIVQKINVWSTIRLFFNLFFFLGILIDVAIFGMYGFNVGNLPSILNISSNIFVVLYFLFSFAITLGVVAGIFFGFMAALYNITADIYGGIKVCVSSEDLMEIRNLQNELDKDINEKEATISDAIEESKVSIIEESLENKKSDDTI